VSQVQLLIPVIVVLTFIVPALYRLLRKGPRKAKTVVEYAQKRGYALVNPVAAHAVDMSPLEMMRDPTFANLQRASLDISDIRELERGTGDWLAFICSLRSKEVTVFNLTRPSRQTDGRGSNLQYKVAKIKAPGLP
jgi:hypothetical protein